MMMIKRRERKEEAKEKWQKDKRRCYTTVDLCEPSQKMKTIIKTEKDWKIEIHTDINDICTSRIERIFLVGEHNMFAQLCVHWKKCDWRQVLRNNHTAYFWDHWKGRKSMSLIILNVSDYIPRMQRAHLKRWVSSLTGIFQNFIVEKKFPTQGPEPGNRSMTSDDNGAIW